MPVTHGVAGSSPVRTALNLVNQLINKILFFYCNCTCVANWVLSHFLSHLCEIQKMILEGSLVIFGFNFGEYDTHIIAAINKACHYGKKSGNKLHRVYIGVYSDEDFPINNFGK